MEADNLQTVVGASKPRWLSHRGGFQFAAQGFNKVGGIQYYYYCLCKGSLQGSFRGIIIDILDKINSFV